LGAAAGWEPSGLAAAAPLVGVRSTGFAAPKGEGLDAGAAEGVEGFSSRRVPLPKILGRLPDVGGVSDLRGTDPAPPLDAGGR